MSEIEEKLRRELSAHAPQATDAVSANGSGGADEPRDGSVLMRPVTADDGAIAAAGSPVQTAAAADPQPYYAAARPTPVKQRGLMQRWKAKGGVWGVIATALMTVYKIGAPALYLLSKLKFLALAGKLLLTGGSMLISIWFYSLRFGWSFAVGLVALIFIHECGHALAARMRGISTGIMVFVPFMGAFVTTNRAGRNLVEDAFIGILGPVVGSAASLVCALLYLPTGNPFWLALGQWGFFINLFNLLPTPPLDGGWIAPLFSPKLLAVGMVIALVVGFKNPLIWLLLLASVPRIVSGWKADPKTQPYYRVAVADKWRYGVAYVGLAAFLALGGHAIDTYLLM